MKVYVVVVDDRHADTTVEVFADKYVAIEYARDEAEKGVRRDGQIEEPVLNDAMVREHWVYYAIYGGEEGDSVWVVWKDIR